MAPEKDRRVKSPMTRISEVAAVATSIGVFGLLVEFGVYKQKIDDLTEQFQQFKVAHADLQCQIRRLELADASRGRTVDP